jgi:hypothetical protein
MRSSVVVVEALALAASCRSVRTYREVKPTSAGPAQLCKPCLVAFDLHVADAQPPPEEHLTTIATFLAFAGDVIDEMLKQRGFNPGDLRVTITSKVQAAVAAEVEALGLHPDQAAQLEPLGGLSGKTLVDHEWVPVAVVVGWSPGPSPLSTLQVIAHELGHVLAITIGTAPISSPRSFASRD